jgi:hypothetical protein
MGWFVLVLTSALTEAPAQISGLMLNVKGEPAIGAEIFINRTTIRAVTDEFGQFTLTEVPPGFHEIIAYKKGFTLYRAPMRVLEGRTYTLNLTFRDTEKKPRGRSTEESNNVFAQAILGNEGLMLFNPDSKPEVEVTDGKFRVLSGPVVMEYPNGGYRITAYFSPQTPQALSDAAYCYQEYNGSNVNQNIAFERTRMSLYKGSLRHWLMALWARKTTEEGFSMTDGDGKPIDMSERIVASSTAGYHRIRLGGSVTVRYQDQSTSTVSAADPIDVNALGIMINPRLLITEGAMNNPGLAHQLPLDYRPIANDIDSTFAEALKYFYEKIYVQTDKPYYYPGEPLWFKTYINYYHPVWMDTLSDVLYVDFMGPQKQVLLERMFRIENGRSHGDFILPDSLAEGTYYLRAYTNLRRNFGDEGLFTKPLYILSLTDKVDPSLQRDPQGPQGITLIPKQKTYQPRDRITVNMILPDSLRGAANLSISVTDAAQVIAIPEPITIATHYPIVPSEISRINELVYRIERGVSFYGQFLNNKGVGEKTQLSFIQWKTGDVLMAETEEDGMFWQTGLQFTDSALFSYKSDKAKGRPYGSVKILPREVPPLHPGPEPELNIVKAGTVQRIYSAYEVPKETTLLEAVEITGRREEKEEFERNKKRPYGRADHILTSKNLNIGVGSLLFALVGKVPGLIVNPSQGVVYYSRAVGTSITAPNNPLVTVNDIPMYGDAGTILNSLDYNTIESIEFTSRLNVLYGSQGSYGVIAVYTKEGGGVDRTDPNFQIIKLPGFSKTRNFVAPDYEKPTMDATQADYRSLIYWNPNVDVDAKTGTTAVSFFAADLAGLYRVVVEGVTAGGVPVRGETYLVIEEKR